MRFSSVRAVVDAVTSWEFWCWVVMVPFFAWIVWTGFSDPQFFANHRFFDRSVPSAGSSESTVEPTAAPLKDVRSDSEKMLDQVQKLFYAMSVVFDTHSSIRHELLEDVSTSAYRDALLSTVEKFEAEYKAERGERKVLRGSEKVKITGAQAEFLVCADTNRVEIWNSSTQQRIEKLSARASYVIYFAKNQETSIWEVDQLTPIKEREVYCDSFIEK